MTNILPIAASTISKANNPKKTKTDMLKSAAVGATIGAATTAVGLLYTAKKGKLKLSEMVKMFGSKLEFFKSTTFLPNIAIGAIAVAALSGCLSFIKAHSKPNIKK